MIRRDKGITLKKVVYGKERTIISTFNQNLYDDQLKTLINDLEKCREKLSLLSLHLNERAGGLITLKHRFRL